MPADRPRPTLEQLARYAAQFNQSHSLRHFGLRIEFPTVDKVVVVVDEQRPEHQGGLGTGAFNGGVLASVFDLAIGCTAALVDPTRRTATVHLSMSFERAVRGATLRGEAVVDRAAAGLVFGTAVIYDGEGNACARCQGIAAISDKPWASGESPAVN